MLFLDKSRKNYNKGVKQMNQGEWYNHVKLPFEGSVSSKFGNVNLTEIKLQHFTQRHIVLKWNCL